MNYETDLRSEHAEYLSSEKDAQTRLNGRRKQLIVIALLVIALAAMATYYLTRPSASAAEAAADGPGDAQVPAVTVVPAQRSTVEGIINTSGTLAARRALPVGVAGEGGQVVSVPVDQGQWVRAGQVLAVIDRSVQTQQNRSAAAQIRVAQADADLAQANLDRASQLVERGFISKAEIDRLTATRDAALARVRVAQAQLGELQARAARLNVVAPAAGLVLERNVEPGQTVSAGSGTLFLIAKGGEMELLAQVNETELAEISVGTQAEVTPVGSAKAFAGQVWQVAPTINPQDRQGTARIALPYAPELRPGGFASATILSGTTNAAVLPESAVQNDDDGSYVFIVGPQNKVQRRAITLGSVTPRGITIAQGLSGNERIVLRAGGFLNEGDVVRPVLERTR